MTPDLSLLLSLAEGMSNPEEKRLVKEFLNDPATIALGEFPSYQSISSLLTLMLFRQELLKKREVTIPGMALLIENLKDIQPDQSVFGYGYEKTPLTGVFYVNQAKDKIIGFLILKQRFDENRDPNFDDFRDP